MKVTYTNKKLEVMPNIVTDPKEILHKCIQNFYKSNPLARFEDIPNKVFIEAMQMYADDQLRLQRQELMSILTTKK